MKVTVVIPVYNRSGLLKRAVESVAAQTYRPVEIIIVDDGSTDEPAAVLPSPVGLHLKVIKQENLGVAAARNAGIKAATTDWLAFLDSDDWWLPDKLARQVSWHNRNRNHLISQTDEVWIRNGRRVNARRHHAKPAGDIFRLSLERCLVSPSAVMVRRSLFEETGLFDTTFPVCEDYDMWLRISAKQPVGLVPEKLVVKTGGHADQLSRKYWGMDRWRVEAIAKLLASGALAPGRREAAIEVMNEKISILRGGAAKRGNHALQSRCDELTAAHPL